MRSGLALGIQNQPILMFDEPSQRLSQKQLGASEAYPN